MLETKVDNDKRVLKNLTGNRSVDVTSFQRSFIPSYKQMFKSMMCDVLAHADFNGASHYVIRRPFWHNNEKQFQYGYLRIPYDSNIGKSAYNKMLESNDFWGFCYSMYLDLKGEMFDSLGEKDGLVHILRDVARENYLSIPVAEFVAKSEAALDKK